MAKAEPPGLRAQLANVKGLVNMTPLEAFDLYANLSRGDVDATWKIRIARGAMQMLVREALGGKR